MSPSPTLTVGMQWRHRLRRAVARSPDMCSERNIMTDNSKKRLVETLVADLDDETRGLTPLLASLPEAEWDTATPAEGWCVRDQVTHLAFFDDAVLLSLRDPAAFTERRAEQFALGAEFPDMVAEQHRHLSGPECLAWFVRAREAVLAQYRAADPALRLP